jgi:hypothetical protein
MLQSLDTLIAFIVILLTTSLLVTILVQMLSSAFALRGKNLGNALALTFQSIDPTIGAAAYKLAERILADPRLSDSLFANKKAGKTVNPNQDAPWGWWSLGKGWQLAGDIRPDEIHQLLTKISCTAGDNLGPTATNLLGKLNVPNIDVAKAKSDLAAVETSANTLADSAEKTAVTNAVTAATASLQSVADHIATELDSLAQHFNTAHDRAQQWFQTHTRIFTIACGILLAFLLQLDSVEIFKFVSTNAVGRAALVASADKVVKEADSTLDEKGGLIKRIADAWASKHKQATIDLKGISHTGQLQEALANQTSDFQAKDFDDLVEATTKAYYKDQSDKLTELTKGVSATGFDFLPKKLGQRWGAYGETFWAHFWGMLITAGLLSLGAPFWYNSLKDLTSLRPAVSKLIGEEKAAETKTKK